MVPAGLGGTLFLLALIPGWFYLRLRERLRPPSGTSGLGELLEVLAVGLATTGVSAAVITLIPHRFAPILVDVDAWASATDVYPVNHVRTVIGSFAIVLALALAASYTLYRLQRHNLPDEFRASESVWVQELGVRPSGTTPWVGIQLSDGRLVEGLLHSYTLSGSIEERDIALARPIRVSEKAGSAAQDLTNIDRVIVPARNIEWLTVIHVAEKKISKVAKKKICKVGR